jgi:hypothetical protein
MGPRYISFSQFTSQLCFRKNKPLISIFVQKITHLCHYPMIFQGPYEILSFVSLVAVSSFFCTQMTCSNTLVHSSRLSHSLTVLVEVMMWFDLSDSEVKPCHCFTCCTLCGEVENLRV